MPIKNPTSQDNATITVILRDKTKYNNADIPAQIFAVDGMVSFWYKNKLMAIPLDLVESVTVDFNDES